MKYWAGLNSSADQEMIRRGVDGLIMLLWMKEQQTATPFSGLKGLGFLKMSKVLVI
jgi:hypothetical protein